MEKTTLDTSTEDSHPLDGLFDFDVEITFSGHKSSEGDGRTAADIEREMAQRGEK